MVAVGGFGAFGALGIVFAVALGLWSISREGWDVDFVTLIDGFLSRLVLKYSKAGLTAICITVLQIVFNMLPTVADLEGAKRFAL